MRAFIITSIAVAVLQSNAFAQDVKINLTLVKKILPIEEHRNCSMILRNVRRDMDNQTLLLPPREFIAVKQLMKDSISFIDLLQAQRIDAGEITDARWKKLLDTTPKAIWDYEPIQSYEKAKPCLEKLERIANNALGADKATPKSFVCSGNTGGMFAGIPDKGMPHSCGFSLNQLTADVVELKYSSTKNPTNPSSCLLDKISGNDPSNPNNKNENNWKVSRFSSKEITRTFADGFGVDRSAFVKEGRKISFYRYNFQPYNGLNWTSELIFQTEEKTLQFKHTYHDGKKVVAVTIFNATCASGDQ